ncbi:MAG TPA: PIN domain-containing protein [Firmicutes bacterium]|nr:PIN domain-containing protein [Bacillota bacterium]
MDRITKAFIDTNVLVSAIVFGGTPLRGLELAVKEDVEVVVSTYVVDELYEVLRRRFPSAAAIGGKALEWLSPTVVSSPSRDEWCNYLGVLTDEKDLPILVAALKAGVQVLVSGDQGFHKPEIGRLLPVYDASRFFATLYSNRAMKQASYSKLPDGGFCGRVPPCTGVIAFAHTLEGCRKELFSVLLDWVLLGLQMGHTLPDI